MIVFLGPGGKRPSQAPGVGGAISVVLLVALKVAALVAVPVPVSTLSLEVMSLAC